MKERYSPDADNAPLAKGEFVIKVLERRRRRGAEVNGEPTPTVEISSGASRNRRARTSRS